MFQKYMTQAMVKIGFTVVRVAAQTFYHAARLVLATVHGDDLIASGETQWLDMLDEALEQCSVLKKLQMEPANDTHEENSELECGRISLEG